MAEPDWNAIYAEIKKRGKGGTPVQNMRDLQEQPWLPGASALPKPTATATPTATPPPKKKKDINDEELPVGMTADTGTTGGAQNPGIQQRGNSLFGK